MRWAFRLGCLPWLVIIGLLAAIRFVGGPVNTAVVWIEQHSLTLITLASVVVILWIVRKIWQIRNPYGP